MTLGKTESYKNVGKSNILRNINNQFKGSLGIIISD